MSDKPTRIRVISFSRTCKSNYRPWRIKTVAIISKYGWIGALDADYMHAGIPGAALTDAFKEG
jgi:hypothetical protein